MPKAFADPSESSQKKKKAKRTFSVAFQSDDAEQSNMPRRATAATSSTSVDEVLGKRRSKNGGGKGVSDKTMEKFLDRMIRFLNDGMSSIQQNYGGKAGDPEGKEVVRKTTEFIANDQWMPYTRSKHGMATTAVRRVKLPYYKKLCKEAREKATAKANAEIKKLEAKRQKVVDARRKAMERMQKRAMSSAKGGVGFVDDFDGDEDEDLADFFMGLEPMADDSAEKDTESMVQEMEAEMAPVDHDKIHKAHRMAAMKALHKSIKADEMGSKCPIEEKHATMKGLTERQASIFYPRGDPFFSNIASRNSSLPSARKHSFMRTCGVSAATHGTVVHSTCDAFLKWYRSKNKRTSSRPFLDSLSAPVDPCVERVFSTMMEAKLYPIAAEVPVMCTLTNTLTFIDFLVYDLSVEDKIGVRLVELKTGCGGCGDFKTPSSDDINMEGPMAKCKDTPYMRAALQAVLCISFALSHYGFAFTGADVLHVPKNPSDLAKLYSLPRFLIESPKTIEDIYAYYALNVLKTSDARCTSLRTIFPDPDTAKRAWRDKMKKRRQRK